MRSKRMLMGAAVFGCIAATMTSGAYAQEGNTTGQFHARSSQQASTAAQANASMRHGQGANLNAQVNARANGYRAAASPELGRRGVGTEGRLNASTREGREFAEQRGMRGERRTYARVSEERYGRGMRGEHGAYARVPEERYGQGLRGERRLYAREGGYRDWRGERAYREHAVGVGTGVAAADYGYRTRRLYAYAPSYNAASAGPYSNYAPGYDVGVNTAPYTPGWNVAYASPYYDYAPGISFGLGPVGIGVGPAWGW
jgi:hypothetical protein